MLLVFWSYLHFLQDCLRKRFWRLIISDCIAIIVSDPPWSNDFFWAGVIPRELKSRANWSWIHICIERSFHLHTGWKGYLRQPASKVIFATCDQSSYFSHRMKWVDVNQSCLMYRKWQEIQWDKTHTGEIEQLSTLFSIFMSSLLALLQVFVLFVLCLK